MGIAQRIHDTIEDWQAEWKDRLLGWLINWVSNGLKTFLESEEPELVEEAQGMIDRVMRNPKMPEAARAILGGMKGGGQWIQVVLLIIGIILFAVQLIQQTFRPAFNVAEYEERRTIQDFRFDPISVITAWRRDKPAYERLFDDLRDQGWSDERIEALKFVTLFYPAPADLVRWQAREVFEPDMVAKYGLDDELGAITREPFYKAGMTDEQITNYWRAHWEHASWIQIVEMLHRGLITEQDVRDWFRLVEIPPFWRQLLIDSAYTWPTRVDVRRWWDMRTIDEAELRRLYSGMGYHGVNLDNYVLWTKVYVAFPDLLARFTNGWITLEDVRDGLVALGMPSVRVEEMIQTKIKPSEPARTTSEKNLTKTEIYKGVKKELLTWDQGVELLMDLGYDEDEADYILAINVGVLAGSPETYEEFKDLTQKYRLAAGMESVPMTEELKRLGAELITKRAGVDALRGAVAEEKAKLVPGEELPEAATARLKELEVALHKAEAELQRVQTDYNSQVAAWRHGAG